MNTEYTKNAKNKEWYFVLLIVRARWWISASTLGALFTFISDELNQIDREEKDEKDSRKDFDSIE